MSVAIFEVIRKECSYSVQTMSVTSDFQHHWKMLLEVFDCFYIIKCIIANENFSLSPQKSEPKTLRLFTSIPVIFLFSVFLKSSKLIK
uniref:Uncharacterized protein n=1 Tax=Lepeophtheirus salmonis TaxID=72036 RepID=A0A0K2TD08_LEPSM